MGLSIRAVVIFSVWIFLAYWIYDGLRRVSKVETNFNNEEVKDSFSWPMVSICPMYFFGDKNASNTFEEAMLEIEKAKGLIQPICASPKIKAEAASEGVGPDEYLVLRNQTHLARNNNMTIDDIFSYAVSATSSNNKPVVCTSIDLSKLNMTRYAFMMVNIYNDRSMPTGFAVLNTEPLQFDASISDKRVNPDMIPRKSYIIRSISLRKSMRLNTDKYKCDEENNQKVTPCVEQYIVEQLKCKPPWFWGNHGKIMKSCTNNDDFETYVRLTQDIRTLAPKCFEKNCVMKTWFRQDFMTLVSSFENVTTLQYILQDSDVLHENEVLTYSVLDVMNDFAGVASLLLGASIVSSYDFIIEVMAKLKRKLHPDPPNSP